GPEPVGATPTDAAQAVPTPAATAPAETPSGAPVSLQQLRDAWPEILEVVKKAKRAAWMVAFTASARSLAGDVLTLSFRNESDVASFREPQGSGESVSEQLRAAIHEVLGIRVKFL